MSDEILQPVAEFSENNESATQKLPTTEIAKLHRECAKYRNALKTSNLEKDEALKRFEEIKTELDSVCKQKREREIFYTLEKFGCLKPDLVIKDIPENCENVEDFLSSYKTQNPFLFESPKTKHGFAFRSNRAVNYSPSQQMNNYIRSALGR